MVCTEGEAIVAARSLSTLKAFVCHHERTEHNHTRPDEAASCHRRMQWYGTMRSIGYGFGELKRTALLGSGRSRDDGARSPSWLQGGVGGCMSPPATAVATTSSTLWLRSRWGDSWATTDGSVTISSFDSVRWGGCDSSTDSWLLLGELTADAGRSFRFFAGVPDTSSLSDSLESRAARVAEDDDDEAAASAADDAEARKMAEMRSFRLSSKRTRLEDGARLGDDAAADAAGAAAAVATGGASRTMVPNSASIEATRTASALADGPV